LVFKPIAVKLSCIFVYAMKVRKERVHVYLMLGKGLLNLTYFSLFDFLTVRKLSRFVKAKFRF
jgi:hypothetical protein